MPKNILVADADSLRGLHTALLLKRFEYNVFTAENSLDLLRIVNGVLPNLVLLDLGFSFSNGEDSLGKIREDKALDIIKIVMAGERSCLKDLEESLGNGADGYVLRPFSPSALYGAIQTLTGSRRKTPRLRVLFKVTILDGSARSAFFATTLSEMGLFIRTLNPLPEGTRIKMHLELPSPKPVLLDGEVIYQVRKSEGLSEPGMGVRFLNIGRGVEHLRKFIEGELAGEVDIDMFV